MESNQNTSGDELTGTQKEAQLRALMQRTGYQLRQVCRFDRTTWCTPLLELFLFEFLQSHDKHFEMNVRKPQLPKQAPPTAFQENGQRRYGGPPPDWNGPPPERGSEIFVGKLPRDLFEDELVPLCEKVTEERLPLLFLPVCF